MGYINSISTTNRKQRMNSYKVGDRVKVAGVHIGVVTRVARNGVTVFTSVKGRESERRVAVCYLEKVE